MKIKDDGIEISSDFECGNGENIVKVAKDHFKLDAKRDWGRGDKLNMLAWYFCIKAVNSSNRKRFLKFDVRAEDHQVLSEAYVWAKRGKTWNHASAEVLDATGDDWIVRVCVEMESGETVYLSNGFWCPPSETEVWLKHITENHPDMCVEKSISQTAQGRPISVLTIADPNSSGNSERILIAASPQGSEIGVWACRHVIDFLLGDEPVAEKIRKKWVIDVVPQTNPDSEALGTVMINSLGENPLFEFKKIAQGGSGCAEAEALWNWAVKYPPAVYIEYHSYYQANRPWSFRPYLFSLKLHHLKERKTAAEEVARNLLEISTGPPMEVDAGDERFSKCFPYQLIEHFDTIAHFYKLHMRETPEDNLNQAVRVLKAVTFTV